MPYIDFSGGSKQTPVKETPKFFTCNNCIHRYIINKDLFFCTINGTIEFYNAKKPYECPFKSIENKNRKLIIAVYYIKDDGSLIWTGYTSLFLSDSTKTDDDVVKLFYEKAIPDIQNKLPKTKDLTFIPIIVGEAIENGLFYGIMALMPHFVLNDIISNLNKNINNLGALTDE